MIISVLCPIHRWGGLDMFLAGLEHQTFKKEDYELILCDKLYNERHKFIEQWSEENNINVIHFAPENQSTFHVHSSVLNECLNRASGEYCIVVGDYTYMPPDWIYLHWAYNNGGYCLSAPQKIYGLPRLSPNLEHPISTFAENFNVEMLKVLPQFNMDPKLQLPDGALIDFHYWYNRNESFPTNFARNIGGWDERYNDRPGPSNLEFGLRLQHEAGCQIACDARATIYRIMSYPIPPHVDFLSTEVDDSINQERYKELCKKYNVSP